MTLETARRLAATSLPEQSSPLRMPWVAYSAVALLLLSIDNLALWSGLVVFGAVSLWVLGKGTYFHRWTVDRRDLVAIGVLFLAVVGTFRLAFTVFTTNAILGLLLCFAAGLVIGVVGPIVYQVWVRDRTLASLGIGGHRMRSTVALGVVLAAIQLAMTLWGYDLPAAVDWVPLLVMSLVVGLFEAVFFRGFIQSRLEASFGVAPSIAGAASLYSLYHMGYGMGVGELWFLFGLGVVYAVIFRLTENILVLWPLLTPMGAFFNNLEAGDIDLPWASIAGFADVAAVMALVIWLAHRRERKAAPVAANALVSG